MNPSIYRILFGRGGKPRGWTRRVVFRADRSVRGPFRRLVYKRNGRVRPEFSLWLGARGKPAALAASDIAGAVGEPARHAVDEALAQLQTFERMVAGQVSESRPAALLTPAEILAQLPASMPVILSVGRDTSSGRVGGVQLCLDREARLAAERGMLYLRFEPWDALAALAEPAGDPNLAVRLVLNGTALGATTMQSLAEAARRLREEGRDLRLVIHQLLGHSPEAITQLRRAAGIDRCLLWLHDFFTICPGYTLLRNRIAYCGAPAPSSNACTLCVFGEARPMHLERIGRFLEQNAVEVVAPSHATAEFWTSKVALPFAAVHVVPHVVLSEAPAPARQGERPVTVGFLGAPYTQKGWPVFLDLMLAVSGPGVRFVVLSETRPMRGEDDWRKVRNTIEDPEAMTRAVRELQIDLALIWPSGPETFSLTTHEALAGGAFVLTNPGSGNVQAVVRSTGRGVVLDDTAALVRYFLDGSADRLGRAARAAGGLSATPSELSFAVPGWT